MTFANVLGTGLWLQMLTLAVHFSKKARMERTAPVTTKAAPTMLPTADMLTNADASSAMAEQQGVDVTLTIFCDFRLFSTEKVGVFLKKQCCDQNDA
jgi:hypothetical protein